MTKKPECLSNYDDYNDLLEAHRARRVELGVIRRANIVGPSAVLDLLPVCAFKIKDWRCSRSPVSKSKTVAAIAKLGYSHEYQFDAAHGRRYRLMVFEPADRAAILSYGCVRGEE